MVYSPTNPIQIQKNFNFRVEEVLQEDVPHIKLRGYASKMLTSEGKLVIDADYESIDSMGINLKRLHSGNLPLLFGHNHDKAIGKVTGAYYRPDGLEIEATVYKLKDDPLTNYVYEAVKAGILNSFSVGISVSKFGVITQDGEEFIQLIESELLETSIVAVPANNLATFFILSDKGVDTTKRYLTVIGKESLQKETQSTCGKFEDCILTTKRVHVKTSTPEVPPTVVQEVPVVVQEIPAVVQEVPVVVQEVPAVVQEVPTVPQEVPAVVQEVPAVVQEVPIVVQEIPRTADDFVIEAALLGANIEKIDIDDLNKYYNAAYTLLGVVEEHVRVQVKNEVLAKAD